MISSIYKVLKHLFIGCEDFIYGSTHDRLLCKTCITCKTRYIKNKEDLKWYKSMEARKS